MRPLTETETQILFTKLATLTGRSLTQLIQPSDKERYVFRLVNTRAYYVREDLANLAGSIARGNLLSLGTCLGRFSKSFKRFRLHITVLDIISPHARYKVWVKPNGEMPFLYGGNIVKAHIGRWSEDCTEKQGVVVYSMNDTPLGFGISNKSVADSKNVEPTAITTFRQADIGEYLREEDSLFATT